MKPFVVGAIVFGILGTGACAHRPPLIYPPPPAGYVVMDGALMQLDGRGPVWSLDSVRFSGRKLIWFGLRQPLDPAAEHRYLLLDTLSLPWYRSTQAVVLADCSAGGVPDYQLIALTPPLPPTFAVADTDTIHTLVAVWRADTARRRIVPIDSTGVACWLYPPRRR